MNVIVSNKNQSLLNSLDVDVIKNINGEFTVDELLQTFSNFFFNKMFLDITAIRGYADISNIQKLSMNLNMDKVILYLDDFEETNAPNYLSALISIGVYNFTKTKEGLMYLYSNPNSYKDVAHLHIINPVNNAVQGNIIGKVFNSIDNNNNNLSTNVTMNSGSIVIGFKNVTLHAGATSLVYMIKKYLSSYKNVVALEIEKKDLIYFRDNDLVSISAGELQNTLNKYRDSDVILIDLNNSHCESYCKYVVNLIEPSTIKLNKMVLSNRGIFNILKDAIVVLNQSLLSDNDVLDFEYESKIKIFANIPPLNDKEQSFEALVPFLNKLGID